MYDPNNIRHAVSLLRDYTNGHFNIGRLAGPSNSGVRQDIMTALLDAPKKTPKDKCGITALRKSLFEAVKVPTDECLAVQQDQFADLCRLIVDVTTENDSLAPTDQQIQTVFQMTAEAIGSDILAACEECGEEPLIPRDVVVDYIDMYGGKDKEEVVKWLSTISFDDMDAKLDSVGVFRNWS